MKYKKELETTALWGILCVVFYAFYVACRPFLLGFHVTIWLSMLTFFLTPFALSKIPRLSCRTVNRVRIFTGVICLMSILIGFFDLDALWLLLPLFILSAFWNIYREIYDIVHKRKMTFARLSLLTLLYLVCMILLVMCINLSHLYQNRNDYLQTHEPETAVLVKVDAYRVEVKDRHVYTINPWLVRKNFAEGDSVRFVAKNGEIIYCEQL
jgi:hypothetical protein